MRNLGRSSPQSRLFPQPARGKSRIASGLRFLLGVLTGLLLAVAGILGTSIVFNELTGGDVVISASGEAMTAKGVRRLVIERRSGQISQSCNSACDDIRIDSRGRGNAPATVRALDTAGHCVLCRASKTLAFTGSAHVWQIRAADVLTLNHSKTVR